MSIIIGKSARKNVAIDLDRLMASRLLIQADSGGGKSWLLRRLCEQLFGKVQLIVIDPEGEFATLREKFGFVLVGKGGETPADPRSAALVAHRLLELRASAICDIYELKHHARHAWVAAFLESLTDIPKKLWGRQVVIVVDESHMFCPEKGKGESEAYGAMVDLCTRGRKRGHCAVFATQRLGQLSKDASSQLQNRLIGPTFEDKNPVMQNPRPDISSNGDSDLTPYQLDILRGLAQLEALGRSDVSSALAAVAAGKSGTSSTFERYRGKLQAAGLITYPSPGRIALTEEGRRIAPPSNAPLESDELQAKCLALLTPYQQDLLRVLIAAHPDALTREELGEKSFKQSTSSTFERYVGAMKGMEIVTYPNPKTVKCADWLFLE